MYYVLYIYTHISTFDCCQGVSSVNDEIEIEKERERKKIES